MRTDIIQYLEKEIKRRCESERNCFGMGVYNHIKAVVENGAHLARQLGADEEVVIISAWLHDIASVTDFKLYEEHHIHGAEVAKEILQRLDYDRDKIELVQKCILNHRGSKVREKQSIEEQCMADADAISHFYDIPSLFYLAYANRKLGMEEGKTFVKNKLERSYNKLSIRSKVLYKEKYNEVMRML